MDDKKEQEIQKMIREADELLAQFEDLGRRLSKLEEFVEKLPRPN